MKRALALVGLSLITLVASATSAIGQVYTDDPLVAGTTPIKAVHITELRTAIANLRVTLGLPVFPFTDPTLTQQVTTVRAVHVSELRTALNDVFGETDDFRPWIRLWAPNGAQIGEFSGLTSAQILNAVAPVGGT